VTLPIPLGPPRQLAYCVDDADAAAAEWAARFGAGPFFVRRHIPVSDVVVRGRPGHFDHTSAYGQWGSMMVELVQQHDDAPSAVRDMYQPGQTGLHHVAHIVDDLAAAEAALEAAGIEQAQSAMAGTTRFVFHDARPQLGYMLELYQTSPGLIGFYAMVAAAADGWDGSDPVRILG
jgi:hypothetical protein